MIRILSGLGIWILSISVLSCKQEIKKPNILFIMSDDHTTQALGIYRSHLAILNPTPVLDSLAKQGIIFDNVFCTNSICSPSRANIMTGQYSQTNGVLEFEKLPPERQYLAHEMRKLGYETAVIGKWHLLSEPASFNYYCVLPGQGKYSNPDFLIKGKDKWPDNIIKTEGHSSDVITDLSINWLKQKKDKNKPFFLMHHYKAPHDMFKFAPRYKNYLENTSIPEPATMYYNANNGSIATRGKRDSLIHWIGSSVSHRNIKRNMGMHMHIDQNIPDPEYTHLAYQEYLKRYLRCVKGVDDNVGRLLQFLEDEKILDNTIIIYTGDQGFMLGEHDYIDKRWMYEESMRMPFFVYHPSLKTSGKRSRAIVNNTDFAPTILELAGGNVPAYMQGHSFKSIIETGIEPESWQKSTYYRYWMHMAHNHNNPAHFGIRTERYKLIFFYGTDYKNTGKEINGGNRFKADTPVAWELYDLKNDPFEIDNRYNDPYYAAIIDSLKIELMDLRIKLNEDDLDYPHIQKIIETNWAE